MNDQSRREFLARLGAVTLGAPLVHATAARTWRGEQTPEAPRTAPTRACPVRTITAFVALDRLTDRAAIEQALARLARAKRQFEAEGYEVQTTRVVLPPVVAKLDARDRRAALAELRAIDALCGSRQAMLGLGPVLT